MGLKVLFVLALFGSAAFAILTKEDFDMPSAGSAAISSALQINTAKAAPVFERSGISKKYIAQAGGDVDSAISGGCVVTRSVFSNYQRKMAAMECDSGVAESLGLQEDLPIYALDLVSNQLIGADMVHSGGNTGQGMKVAVLDTGIDYNHPDLKNSYLGGYDFVNNDNDPMDDHGHGTAIAGIITADADNAAVEDGPISYRYGPARGVAPGTGIVALKVMNGGGMGEISTFAAAVYWAIDGPDGIYGTGDDPRVSAISASLGFIPYSSYCDHISPAARDAINYADSKNIPVVVAAGNDGTNGVRLPACISSAIAVGAVNKNTDTLAPFSGQGYGVDITAPGTDICTTIMGGGYSCTGVGTSDSAPMVAATVALIKKAHPAYTSSQVKQALRNMAVDKTGGKMPVVDGSDALSSAYTRPFSIQYGWGRVNSYASTVTPNFGYHTECRNNACALVSGAGADQCQSTAECFCTDSDGGQDYFVAGQTSGMGGNAWDSKFDTCTTGTLLTEHYCSGRSLMSKKVSCPNGGTCLGGACSSGNGSNASLPDLMVQSVQIPSQMKINTPLNASIATRNIGAAAAGQSATGVYIGRVPQGEMEVPALGPSQAFTGVFEISCNEIGAHNYSVVADIGAQVEESDETNNEAFGTFQCVNGTIAKETLAKKKSCPLRPISVECADDGSADSAKALAWQDGNGCAYTCKKPLETPAVPALGSAKGKAAATTTTWADDKKSVSPAVPASAGAGTKEPESRAADDGSAPASGIASAVDNVANAMVGGDTYARAMTVLGVYLEKFRKE